jgi:hypothetical protein
MLFYTDLHTKVQILEPDYTASAIDIGISHLESAHSNSKIGGLK